MASSGVFLSNNPGSVRMTNPASRISATVPPVIRRTFRDSNAERLDKEDGLVTKNSHSMAA